MGWPMSHSRGPDRNKISLQHAEGSCNTPYAHQAEIPSGPGRRLAKKGEIWKTVADGGRCCSLSCFSGGFIWGTWAFWQSRRERDAIAKIESEMMQGRFGTAARELVAVINRRPHSDKAAYLLGVCEKERVTLPGSDRGPGRALAPPVPEFSIQAIRARLRLTEDRGQFADAERMISEAANDPRYDATELRAMLVPMYRPARPPQRSRAADQSAVGTPECDRRRGVGRGHPAAPTSHRSLTLRPNSVENIRSFLNGAARRAPQDDRVWLGQANLAIRTGDYKGASSNWMHASNAGLTMFRSRAHRLDWAVAANRLDAVEEALTPPRRRIDSRLSSTVSRGFAPARVTRLPSENSWNA